MTFIDSYPGYPTEAVYHAGAADESAYRSCCAKRAMPGWPIWPATWTLPHWRLDNWDLGRQLLNTIQWVFGRP